MRVFACGRCGVCRRWRRAQILPRDLYWSFIMFHSMLGPNYNVWDIRNVEDLPRRVSGCALDDPQRNWLKIERCSRWRTSAVQVWIELGKGVLEVCWRSYGEVALWWGGIGNTFNAIATPSSQKFLGIFVIFNPYPKLLKFNLKSLIPTKLSPPAYTFLELLSGVRGQFSSYTPTPPKFRTVFTSYLMASKLILKSI